MAAPFFILDSKKPLARAALFAVIVLAVLFAWLTVRWQIGNMLAELTPPDAPDAADIGQLAVSLAPADPLSHWLVANEERDVFTPESVDRTVKLYEEVVRLSPNDFRWWIELGRVYEQADRPEKAEVAFKHAVELAPSYTFTHWQFGNFYLRQNRVDEAFAELRKTTEKSLAYREQVFSLAWDYFDHDPQKLEQIAIADSPDVRITLARFYALRGKAEDALRMWNTLTDEQKGPNAQIARSIAQSLHDRRFFRQALEFARQTGIDPDSRFEAITDGGFEQFMGAPEETLFGWRVSRSEGRIDILPDSAVKSEGGRSLRISFRAYPKAELYNIVQNVAVSPGDRYRISFMLRTENLRSGGPPFLNILSGPENTVIGRSPVFPTGTSEWQNMSVEFTVPQNADGVTIVTRREPCSEPCPINGTFWYDDFKLSKLQR